MKYDVLTRSKGTASPEGEGAGPEPNGETSLRHARPAGSTASEQWTGGSTTRRWERMERLMGKFAPRAYLSRTALPLLDPKTTA